MGDLVDDEQRDSDEPVAEREPRDKEKKKIPGLGAKQGGPKNISSSDICELRRDTEHVSLHFKCFGARVVPLECHWSMCHLH